jgi:hypothetical protein
MVNFRLVSATVVVWPSSGKCSLWAMRSMPGAALMSPEKFSRLARRRCSTPADNLLVDALRPLLR